MLNGLAHVFATKSQAEEDIRFAHLVAAPVLNTDFTTARVNGEMKQVLVCATPEQSIYLPEREEDMKASRIHRLN